MRFSRGGRLWLLIAALALCLGLCSPTAAAKGDLTVLVNRQAVNAWADDEGLVYVELEGFCQAADGQAHVSERGDVVTVRLSDRSITAQVGKQYFSADGVYYFCGVAGAVRSRCGKCYVPLEPLAELFSASVEEGDCKITVRTAEQGQSLTTTGAQDGEGELYWLSRIISAEARGESLNGKIAVGNVVMNRVASELFPDTVYGVIFDTLYGVQFSPVANGSVYDEPTEESVLAARLVLDGAEVTGEALYFENEAIAASSWVSRNREELFVLGNHTFYA
ncbi:MAG: cell wall hydrolase [Clostridiales bacterium]|nr:cell wall hydrolase [Clostridiales bacterium]